MPPRSNVPIRIGGSRARTGCKTCKQRHVKCDESWPVCLRCQTGKRNCVYMEPQPKRAQLQMVQRDSNALNLSPSPFGPREIVEVNAVKSFTASLGKELAGCFSDDVWCRVLPLVAQHEPTIWHGIVAVSTLSESVRLNGIHDADPKYQIAVKQYTKAIQGLNIRLGSGIESEPSPNRCAQRHVVLLSCMLFSIFECIRNHWHSALHHICGGMQLMEQWSPGASNKRGDITDYHNKRDEIVGYFDHASLLPTFLSLDSQAVKFNSLVSPDHPPPPAANTASQPQGLTSFTTVDDANAVLSYIVNRTMRWLYWHERPAATGSTTRPTVDAIIAERYKLRTQLTHWDSAFMSLRLSNPQPAVLLLLIQRKIIQVQLEKHSDDFDKRPSKPSELGWDKFQPLFQEAVEHAETYLKLTRPNVQSHTAHTGQQDNTSIPSAQQQQKQPSHTLTITTDLLSPLTLITVKCRNPRTRHRALQILQNYHRTEGLWDSRIIATASKAIIQMEERGAITTTTATTSETEIGEEFFIPDHARVYDVDLNVGEESRRGAMTSAKHVQNMEDGRYYRVEEGRTSLTW